MVAAHSGFRARTDEESVPKVFSAYREPLAAV